MTLRALKSIGLPVTLVVDRLHTLQHRLGTGAGDLLKVCGSKTTLGVLPTPVTARVYVPAWSQ